LEAKPFAIGKILSERQRFIVPIYQRTYAWTEKKHLEPFFEQVAEKASERLTTTKVRFSHYMGALLVIPLGDPVFGKIQSFNVVDGQQRLTTFCLLFAALRDIAKTVSPGLLERQLLDLLVHANDVPMENKKTERFKLQPTAYDRELFRDLVDRDSKEIAAKYAKYYYKNGRLRTGGAPLPLAAYQFFRDSVSDFLGESDANDPVDKHSRLVGLCTAVFEDFKLIVITLAKDDDAQVIFETLNSGGEPLAAMDLVRNDVFYRAIRNEEDTEMLMEEHWKVFEDPFWKQEQVQGRIKKPRIDFYLGHVLSAAQGRIISLGELYAEYKIYTTNNPLSSSKAELIRLTNHVNTYRSLIIPDLTTSLGKLAFRLNVFEVSTAYPLVFVIADSSVAEEEKAHLYNLIASYVIRREICGFGAKNYNNVFVEVAAAVNAGGVSETSFIAAFAKRANSIAGKFPTNTEFAKAILTQPAYLTIPPRRLRFIIEELEFASRDKFAVAGSLQTGLSVEHILPQSWRGKWLLPDGTKVSVDPLAVLDDVTKTAVERRERTIHTLANLTLLPQAANSSVGNDSFADKRDRLLGSLLAMNTEIAKCGDEDWHEDRGIKKRGEDLCEKAMQLWPGIDNT
jgi:hypothetical protein